VCVCVYLRSTADAEPELLESWVASQRGQYQAGPLFLRHMFDGAIKAQLRSYLEGLPCYYFNGVRQGATDLPLFVCV
jgi:hypothetical protein